MIMIIDFFLSKGLFKAKLFDYTWLEIYEYISIMCIYQQVPQWNITNFYQTLLWLTISKYLKRQTLY